MAMAATKPGMFTRPPLGAPRAGRALPPTPIQGAFTLPDPHALAIPMYIGTTAPIFSSPHASLARRHGSACKRFSAPAPGRERRRNAMRFLTTCLPIFLSPIFGLRSPTARTTSHPLSAPPVVFACVPAPCPPKSKRVL